MPDRGNGVGWDDAMAEGGKTTIRIDDGLRADAERCAAERGTSLAAFMRQALAFYIAWIESQKEPQREPQNDKSQTG